MTVTKFRILRGGLEARGTLRTLPGVVSVDKEGEHLVVSHYCHEDRIADRVKDQTIGNVIVEKVS